MQNAFFRIDDGKIGVGRKPDFGHLGALFVVVDTAPAAFFVAAHNEFDRLSGLKAFVFERFERIQADDGRAFVVHCAAAVQFAVFDLAAERRVRPAAACGHYVEVGEDGERFPFAEKYFSHVIVVIARFKAHRRRARQKGLQGAGGAFAEGHALFGGLIGAVYADQFLYGFYGIVQIFFHMTSLSVRGGDYLRIFLILPLK